LNDEQTEDEFSASLQLGLDATPLSWMKFELVYEYDAGTNEQILDEAIVAFQAGDFDAEAGMLYVPFGEYFSHFVTGPFLEFGETRNPGGVFSYTPDDRIDVSAFLYDGKAEQVENGSDWDWGFSGEFSPHSSTTFAVSYLSDLADSEEDFLNESNDLYERRVSALSGYALIGLGAVEVTGEFVHALRSFRELDPEFDQPLAWNVELACYPKGDLEIAFRYERSSELEDAPRWRTGVGTTFRVLQRIYLSFEYLQGRFDLEDDGSETGHYFAARVSVL
jgi:hypothetical protein